MRRASYLLFNLFFLIEQIIPKLFFFKKLKKKNLLAVPHSMWGSLFPDQGSNPRPQHWQHGALTTGPPGFLFLFSCSVMSSSL